MFIQSIKFNGKLYSKLILEFEEYIDGRQTCTIFLDNVLIPDTAIIELDDQKFMLFTLYEYLYDNIDKFGNVMSYISESQTKTVSSFIIVIPSSLDLQFLKILNIKKTNAMEQYHALTYCNIAVYTYGDGVITMLDFFNSELKDGKNSIIINVNSSQTNICLNIMDINLYRKIQAKNRMARVK